MVATCYKVFTADAVDGYWTERWHHVPSNLKLLLRLVSLHNRTEKQLEQLLQPTDIRVGNLLATIQLLHTNKITIGRNLNCLVFDVVTRSQHSNDIYRDRERDGDREGDEGKGYDRRQRGRRRSQNYDVRDAGTGSGEGEIDREGDCFGSDDHQSCREDDETNSLSYSKSTETRREVIFAFNWFSPKKIHDYLTLGYQVKFSNSVKKSSARTTPGVFPSACLPKFEHDSGGFGSGFGGALASNLGSGLASGLGCGLASNLDVPPTTTDTSAHTQTYIEAPFTTLGHLQQSSIDDMNADSASLKDAMRAEGDLMRESTGESMEGTRVRDSPLDTQTTASSSCEQCPLPTPTPTPSPQHDREQRPQSLLGPGYVPRPEFEAGPGAGLASGSVGVSGTAEFIGSTYLDCARDFLWHPNMSQVFATIQKERDVKRLVFTGFSFGAAIAVAFAYELQNASFLGNRRPTSEKTAPEPNSQSRLPSSPALHVGPEHSTVPSSIAPLSTAPLSVGGPLEFCVCGFGSPRAGNAQMTEWFKRSLSADSCMVALWGDGQFDPVCLTPARREGFADPHNLLLLNQKTNLIKLANLDDLTALARAEKALEKNDRFFGIFNAKRDQLWSQFHSVLIYYQAMG